MAISNGGRRFDKLLSGAALQTTMFSNTIGSLEKSLLLLA